MTLIKSISGIRGTIGGKVGQGLTPIDIVKFSAAYGSWLKKQQQHKKLKVVVGRDARISGPMVNQLVVATFQGLGIDVIDLGLSTTPTVEVAVPYYQADGGVILTASHNPKQWNALKLLNNKGEFISGADGQELLNIAEQQAFDFADVDELGSVVEEDFIDKHIEQVINLSLVNKEAIASANFKVAIDAVNSTGGIAIPRLLKALGVTDIVELYCEPNGEFPHNPEPLPEHLTEISRIVKEHKADVGFVVDPDVDRLAMVSEDGTCFGEEYSLVAISDYVLSKTPGNTVSNLSSTRALRYVTENRGGEYHASAVGEVNVVTKMKAVEAVIGGEGNGGIIYPESHYGRDALVGIALFLSHLATSKMKCSELRASYPDLTISKNKIELTPGINVDEILLKIKEKYSNEQVNDIDGVKIDFEKEWVHLRKSNTEPIIRVYAESESVEKAQLIARQIMNDIEELK